MQRRIIMPQHSSAAVLMDQPPEDKEEMEIKEMLEAMRADMAIRDQRTIDQFETLRADIAGRDERIDKRFQEMREDIKEIRTEVKETRAHVDKRVDKVRKEVQDVRKEVHAGIQDVRKEVHAGIQEVRKEIQDARIFKDSRLGLAIAALVGGAVVGTFILQLLDAIL